MWAVTHWPIGHEILPSYIGTTTSHESRIPMNQLYWNVMSGFWTLKTTHLRGTLSDAHLDSLLTARAGKWEFVVWWFVRNPGSTHQLRLVVGVSKNNGTPKSSMLIGFSIVNHLFWGTTIFGNTQLKSHYLPGFFTSQVVKAGFLNHQQYGFIVSRFANVEFSQKISQETLVGCLSPWCWEYSWDVFSNYSKSRQILQGWIWSNYSDLTRPHPKR